METGEIVWFSDEKGFGLVKSLVADLYFVHQSAISSKDRWQSLVKGQRVKFQTTNDDRQTIKVVKVSAGAK